MEYKSFPFEVKEVTEQGLIRGAAAVIGNIDDGGDKILPGAFDRSIKKSNGVMPIFWGHTWEKIPIGYGTRANPTDKILDVEGELTMSIPAVQDAYQSVKHAKAVGFTMGISIGYRIPPKGYEMVDNVRELKEVDVFEWSLTPFPMNRRARVTGLKSFIDTFDVETFTERDLEQFVRDAFELSGREAKTFISRLRVLFKGSTTSQRDAGDVNGASAQLADIKQRIALDRWMAEQRRRLR